MPERISEQDVIDELKRLDETLEGSISKGDMNEHGKYSASTCQAKFETWNAAKQEAGLGTNIGSEKISREDLLEELERMAEEYGPSVGYMDMRAEGRYGGSVYVDEFGSWNNAKEEAELEKNTPVAERWPDRDVCIEQIQKFGIELGRAPRIPDVRSSDVEYETAWYFDKFDSWGELLAEAGFDADPPYDKIPEDVLLTDVQSVSEEIGSENLTKATYDEHGEFNSETIRRRFDGWASALNSAGIES